MFLLPEYSFVLLYIHAALSPWILIMEATPGWRHVANLYGDNMGAELINENPGVNRKLIFTLFHNFFCSLFLRSIAVTAYFWVNH